jgi:amidase
VTTLGDLAQLDAIAQAELAARRDVSHSELLEAFVERYEALNPLIRAVTTIDLERARTAEVPAGPLAGVPFLVKDSTPYPGLRWSMGARLFAHNVAAQQTPLGARLDAAGLLTVGKSACSELGLLASTETLLEGITHNPWDLAISAGGSSGGAAAAVASGLVPLAHANDGGGSLRIPASACGLFGFMPTRGRCVPAALPSRWDALVSDHCISRSVRDSAHFLSLIEDPDGEMAAVGFVRRPLARPLRIAAWTSTLSGHEPEPAVLRAHEDVVRLCESLGHRVEPMDAPDVEADALRDALFLIAGAAAADVVAQVDRSRSYPVQRDELEPFTWSLVDEVERRAPGALEDAQRQLAASTRRYLTATSAFDAVLTPTVAAAGWPIGHLSPIHSREELLRRTGRVNGYAPIQTVAGCPAMSVPLHWTEDGLPLGAHFAAARGADALLLSLALQLEEARPWHDRWAPWSYPGLGRAR